MSTLTTRGRRTYRLDARDRDEDGLAVWTVRDDAGQRTLGTVDGRARTVDGRRRYIALDLGNNELGEYRSRAAAKARVISVYMAQTRLPGAYHPITGRPYRVSLDRYVRMSTSRLIATHDELCSRSLDSSNIDGGFSARQARIFRIVTLPEFRAVRGDAAAVAWYQAQQLARAEQKAPRQRRAAVSA